MTFLGTNATTAPTCGDIAQSSTATSDGIIIIGTNGITMKFAKTPSVGSLPKKYVDRGAIPTEPAIDTDIAEEITLCTPLNSRERRGVRVEIVNTAANDMRRLAGYSAKGFEKNIKINLLEV